MAIGKMTNTTVMEQKSMQMETITLVNGKTARKMVKAHSLGLMERNTKVNGSTT